MRKILWVDDDEGRFEYERLVVREAGWDLTWTTTFEDAIRELRTAPYDAIILDQMVPGERVGAGSPLIKWAACRLLWWLRGRTDWPRVSDERPEDWTWLQTPDTVALADNCAKPAIIVSGIHDPAVFERTRAASKLDQDIHFLSKPVDVDVLTRLLARVSQGR